MNIEVKTRRPILIEWVLAEKARLTAELAHYATALHWDVTLPETRRVIHHNVCSILRRAEYRERLEALALQFDGKGRDIADRVEHVLDSVAPMRGRNSPGSMTAVDYLRPLSPMHDWLIGSTHWAERFGE